MSAERIIRSIFRANAPWQNHRDTSRSPRLIKEKRDIVWVTCETILHGDGDGIIWLLYHMHMQSRKRLCMCVGLHTFIRIRFTYRSAVVLRNVEVIHILRGNCFSSLVGNPKNIYFYFIKYNCEITCRLGKLAVCLSQVEFILFLKRASKQPVTKVHRSIEYTVYNRHYNLNHEVHTLLK